MLVALGSSGAPCSSKHTSENTTRVVPAERNAAFFFLSFFSLHQIERCHCRCLPKCSVSIPRAEARLISCPSSREKIWYSRLAADRQRRPAGARRGPPGPRSEVAKHASWKFMAHSRMLGISSRAGELKAHEYRAPGEAEGRGSSVGRVFHAKQF